MSELKSLYDLLLEDLKDLYSAENQLVKALPKMAKASHSPRLRKGFTKHLSETKTHVKRLESIMKTLKASPRGKTCKAMQGLLKEGQEVIKEKAFPSVKDAALIGAAQKVEHYEMAGYGTVRTYAEILGLDDVAKILQQTLDEEGATDKTLTSLARDINVEAEGPSDKRAKPRAGIFTLLQKAGS